MIHVKLINKTVTAENAMMNTVTPEFQAILDSIETASKTPEWQAYLLGIQEKQNKRELRIKSKNSQNSKSLKLGKQEGESKKI